MNKKTKIFAVIVIIITAITYVFMFIDRMNTGYATPFYHEVPQAETGEGLKGMKPCDLQLTGQVDTALYEKPDASSNVVGTLKSGNYLQCDQQSSSGWSRLIYQGKPVYAETYFLGDEPYQGDQDEFINRFYPGFHSEDELVTAITEVKLLTQPSIDDKESKIVYVLKHGEYIKRTGRHVTHNWSRLEYNGQTVYCASSFLESKENNE